MSNFIKRKLSPEALDEYVLRFVDPNAKKFIPYTTSKNEQVKFSPYLEAVGRGSEHLYYLLGQTLAFHQDNTNRSTCPIEDLIFIINEDGKKEPWTKNSRDFTQLIQLAHETAAFMVLQNKDSSMEFTINRFIKPVIHKEERSTDESDPHDEK